MEINNVIHGTYLFSDRMRVTNNILGDCYASVVVEYLSRKELQESDAEIELTKANSTLAAGSDARMIK